MEYTIKLTDEQIRIIKFLVSNDIHDIKVNDRYANSKEIIEADKEILNAINNAVIDSI